MSAKTEIYIYLKIKATDVEHQRNTISLHARFGLYFAFGDSFFLETLDRF